MKKSIKRLTALAASAMLLIGNMAGCQSNTANEGTTTSAANSGQTQTSAADQTTKGSEERQKVSIMSLTFNGNPVTEDNILVQKLEEYTGYDIEWTWILDADYTDKISTMIAGGTLPEITLLKSIDSNAVQNCRAGAFWDLTDYLSKYENLSQIDDIVMQNIAIDGKVFGIPRSRTLMRHGIVYRQDWLDSLGLKPATTLDEFEEILRQFTFNDPDGNGQNDTWGLVSTKASTGFDTAGLWFGAPNGWGEDASGKLQPAFLFDEYFESMNWLKGLYDEGILNEDFATLENSGVKDAFKAQQTGVYISDADEANSFYTHFNTENIDASLTVTASFETPAGKVAPSTDGFSGILAVSKASVKTEEDLDRCLTFLDKLNDEYCQNLFTYGIEGTDYEVNEDGTVTKLGTGIISLGESDGFNQIMMNVTDKLFKQTPANELAAQVLDVQAENKNYIVSNPGKALLRTSDTYNSVGAQLDQLISDARIQYIVGELDEEGWKSVIESWRQQGGDKVIEEVNASYSK